MPTGAAPEMVTVALIVVEPSRPARGVEETVIVVPLAWAIAGVVVAGGAVEAGAVVEAGGTVVGEVDAEGGAVAERTGVLVGVPDASFDVLPHALPARRRAEVSAKTRRLSFPVAMPSVC